MSGLVKLIDGYRRFRAYGWKAQRERWEELAENQTPKIMVISCSDSRVDPSQIFDARPGEIFAVRNVANLVPSYSGKETLQGGLAALEFAVTQLGIPDIVVMGHAACGGVQAALSREFAETAPGKGGFIGKWIGLLDDARERVLKEHGTGPAAQRALELETVRVSLANLRSFPFIKEREEDGRLTLHGAYFSIADGLLHVMDESGAFKPV